MQQHPPTLSLRLTGALIACLFGFAHSGSALAKVSADEAAKLGDTLTPIGAEKTGDGDRIPAWDGGLPKEDVGRAHHPFEDDEPLFTITAKNAAEYEAVLTPTHKALFKQ